MEAQTKKLIHFRPLFYSFLILTLAISCAKFIFAGSVTYICLVVGIFALVLSFCVWKKKIVYFVILMAVFGFGIGWYFLGISTFRAKEYGGQCQIVARVSDDISFSEYGNRCNVVLKSVKINGNKSKNIYARLNFENKEDIKVGDVISFSTEVYSIKPFQLGQFNSFYYRDNIGYTAEISSSQVSILENKMTVDEKIRQKVKDKVSRVENGPVLYAVLFGDKSDIDDEVKAAYQKSGVVHLLTVSGLHISFLIALLSFILKKCRIRGWVNLLVCSSFVIFYSFLCGWSPSVLRASIMGITLTLASIFGKRYDGLNALGLAGCIILLIRPLLALDLGFLMSFFCVYSIFALYPLFKKLFSKIFPKKIGEAFAVCLSAQIGVFPFALQISGSTNLLSVFANIIIVPIFSVIYPLLFISVLIVIILPFMSFLLTAFSFGFGVIEKVAGFFVETKLVTNMEPLNVLIIATGFLSVMLLSRFFMMGTKTKALCFSVLLCLSCVCVVMPDFWNKPEAGVCVCYEYSNSIILLTNSQCESVIIDVRGEKFTKQLLRLSKVDRVSAVFALQSSKVNIETLRMIGCDKLIRTGSGEGYGEEQLVGLDETGKVSGFTFRYRSDGGKMIGLEIIFDGMKVFVARQRYTTAENFEDIGQENFDLVVLGKLKDCQSAFQKTADFASFYQQNDEFSSFERDGNMKYFLKNKQFVGRCLD